MTIESIRNLVIVGGGTAGWMCAALLGKVLGKQINITLVESDAIGTVGVGEATIPPLLTFHSLLGINESDFMKATQATYKLGIRFKNWGKQGDSYIHPFGRYGDNFDMVAFNQYWLRLNALNEVAPLEDFSLCALAARMGRFSRATTNDPRSIWSTFSYAFHFDAGLYAKFLRQFAEKQGVTRVEGKITHAEQRSDDGFIQSIVLESGKKIGGDFFIDCSGFRGLLIEEVLKTGYDDWSHWLPCNRAVAIPSASELAPQPFTLSIAQRSGWQWRIPLQHRVGNGHVYSSAYMSDDEAVSVLLKNIDGEPLRDPNYIRFTTGARKKVWNKNVLAIGLASGFLEPLESTSIHLVQRGLSKLLSWFPDKKFDQKNIDEYNRIHNREVERIRDFIILHYKATQRDDSDFWNYCRTMAIPGELQNKLDTFASSGRLIELPGDTFQESSWLSVMLGQGLKPTSYDPIAEFYDLPRLKMVMEKMQGMILETAKSMPLHTEFIARHCAASTDVSVWKK